MDPQGREVDRSLELHFRIRSEGKRAKIDRNRQMSEEQGGMGSTLMTDMQSEVRNSVKRET
jgi:hypothetical protein